jgi:hypothetical protein
MAHWRPRWCDMCSDRTIRAWDTARGNTLLFARATEKQQSLCDTLVPTVLPAVSRICSRC